MDVIDAGEAHPFGDNAERDAVAALPRIGRVPCPMQMQDHIVAARPFRHRLDRGVADHQIDHDDDRAEFLGEFGALVHVFHGPGGDVEIGTLDLAGRGLRLVDRLHAIEEALAPVHERLRVDVLVVLGEVEPALQRLIDHASVVAAGKAELRLHGRAEQADGRTCPCARAQPQCRSPGPGTFSHRRPAAACLPGAAPSTA